MIITISLDLFDFLSEHTPPSMVAYGSSYMQCLPSVFNAGTHRILAAIFWTLCHSCACILCLSLKIMSSQIIKSPCLVIQSYIEYILIGLGAPDVRDSSASVCSLHFPGVSGCRRIH